MIIIIYFDYFATLLVIYISMSDVLYKYYLFFLTTRRVNPNDTQLRNTQLDNTDHERSHTQHILTRHY